MKQEYFVVVLAHSLRGRLRRIHIPHQAVYAILALALLGCFSVFGFVASYARMAWKVANYNALKARSRRLRSRYQNLQKVVNQTNQQLASLEIVRQGSFPGLRHQAEAGRPGGYRGRRQAGSVFRRKRCRTTTSCAAPTPWLCSASPPAPLPCRGVRAQPLARRRPSDREPSASAPIRSRVKARSTRASISARPPVPPFTSPPTASCVFADVESGYGQLVSGGPRRRNPDLLRAPVEDFTCTPARKCAAAIWSAPWAASGPRHRPAPALRSPRERPPCQPLPIPGQFECAPQVAKKISRSSGRGSVGWLILSRATLASN